jgi:hypothetical protein
VHGAFAASGIPYAEDTWRRASARLDAYAAGWVEMYNETCRATRVEGRQSDTLLDLRMGCLERRRALLRGLADVWARRIAPTHAGWPSGSSFRPILPRPPGSPRRARGSMRRRRCD